MKLALATLLFATPLTLAQTSAPAASSSAPNTPPHPLTFDVVSIKPNRSGAPAIIDHTPPDGFSLENYPVRRMISNAFNIRPDLISGGPGWLDTDHYDVVAKVAGDDLAAWKALSKAERNQMLQAVLADRFRLVTHPVFKDLPGFTLTVAKGGFKLQPDPAEKRGGWGAGFGDIRATAMTTSTLAELLSRQLQQTVLDQTGLTGNYTFELKWADLNARPAAAAAPDAASEPSALPALPTALEETLGLKLTATKLPTTTLVIDAADRPSEN